MQCNFPCQRAFCTSRGPFHQQISGNYLQNVSQLLCPKEATWKARSEMALRGVEGNGSKSWRGCFRVLPSGTITENISWYHQSYSGSTVDGLQQSANFPQQNNCCSCDPLTPQPSAACFHERLFRLADKGTAICILSSKSACKFPTLMCNYSGSSIDWQLRWRNQFKSQRLMPIVHTCTQYAHSTKMYIYIMHIIATAHKGAHVDTYIYIYIYMCVFAHIFKCRWRICY